MIYILEAYRHDLGSMEIRKMAELASKEGGSSRYDHINPLATTTYRCHNNRARPRKAGASSEFERPGRKDPDEEVKERAKKDPL